MKTLAIVNVMLTICAGVYAGTIDPYTEGSKYAYGENVGWFNFAPSPSGVTVSNGTVSGYVWQENIGWINLSPANFGGVTYDASWKCGGYAWGENVGWINFDPAVPFDRPNLYKVSVSPDGVFSGWAWGENIGWIYFDGTQRWAVRACVVTLDDLTNFASFWLQSGNLPANLDLTNAVDMNDYSIFASYWQDFCPDGWRLK